MWCSAAQAAAAAPALLLLARRHSRGLGLRALALLALRATAANHWMYRGSLFLAVETVTILFVAALDAWTCSASQPSSYEWAGGVSNKAFAPREDLAGGCSGGSSPCQCCRVGVVLQQDI